MPRGVLNVDADRLALLVDVHDQPVDDFQHVGAGFRIQIDVERVSIWIVEQLHRSCSLPLWRITKPRSGKALCTVSPSSSVTTRKSSSC
jgi:hypothetical protein